MFKTHRPATERVTGHRKYAFAEARLLHSQRAHPDQAPRLIPLSEIEPARCDRPHLLRWYAHLLLAGQQPPPIEVIRQRDRYPYRLFDGRHRAAAARRCGLTTIKARVVFDEYTREAARAIGRTDVTFLTIKRGAAP